MVIAGEYAPLVAASRGGVRDGNTRALQEGPSLRIVYNAATRDDFVSLSHIPMGEKDAARISAFRITGDECGDDAEALTCMAVTAPDVCQAAFRLAVFRDGVEEWIGVTSNKRKADEATKRSGAAVFLATATARPNEYFVLCNHRSGLWLKVNRVEDSKELSLSLVSHPTRVRILPAEGHAGAPPTLPTSPALLALVGSRKHQARRAMRKPIAHRTSLSSDSWCGISDGLGSDDYHRIGSDVSHATDEALSVRSISSSNSYVLIDA